MRNIVALLIMIVVAWFAVSLAMSESAAAMANCQKTHSFDVCAASMR